MSKSTHSAKAVVQFDLVWFIVKRSSLRIFSFFYFSIPSQLFQTLLLIIYGKNSNPLLFPPPNYSLPKSSQNFVTFPRRKILLLFGNL